MRLLWEAIVALFMRGPLGVGGKGEREGGIALRFLNIASEGSDYIQYFVRVNGSRPTAQTKGW